MFAKRIDRLAGSLIREILQVTQRPEVISFAGGLPATDIMPKMDFSVAPPEIRQYGSTEGDPRLRQLIAQQLCAIGRDCVPEQILITSGSQQGIDLVARLFIDEGSPVILEAPTYLAAIQSFRLFGARFVELPLAHDGVAPELLRQAITRERPRFTYLIPSFQNPSGCCYSANTREQIAAALDESGTVLVEDDPYRELAYEPTDRTPISGLLKKSPWVYLGSFSKTTCPGIRIGYLACSPELFPLFARLKQATDLHTNRLGQWWVANFIASPDYDLHIQRLRDYYRIRRDALHGALQRHFNALAEWDLPSGGLFFWVRLKQQCDTRHLLSNALEHNVAFMPGEPFFASPTDEGSYLRLNFSHETPARIEQGIGILSDVIRMASLSESNITR